MICPHCHIGTDPVEGDGAHAKHRGQLVGIRTANCTECDGLIVFAYSPSFHRGAPTAVAGEIHVADEDEVLLYPSSVPPREPPADVPAEYANDFREAAFVLEDSPKASAALSRRLLQRTLRDKGGFKARNLDQEIQQAIDSGTLAADLAHDLDALRHVGNFAAHPIKSTNSGEIVGVEAGEAEWLLDLLDELFQHYFTRPAIRARRRADLNTKLHDAGKPTLKGTEAADPSSSES